MAEASVAATTTTPHPDLDVGEQSTSDSTLNRDAYAELAELAGGLAHEIRNPLSTLRLNLDLLAEDFQNPETSRDRRARKKIERIRNESQRLEHLLEDFLRFVRVRNLKREPTDLNGLIDELSDFFEPLADAQGVVIRTSFDASLPPVWVDAELIRQQALFNLIRNAQHAMPEGGELILTTRRQGPWAVIEVTDTGGGIPPEAVPRIFDAFFSTRPDGTGLGLPTARRVVEVHGGTIGVESEPGKGSKFTIRLPIEPPGATNGLANDRNDASL